MSDENFAGVGTPQYVALKLLEAISESEEKASLASSGVVYWLGKADKDWILATYVDCLRVARGGSPTE